MVVVMLKNKSGGSLSQQNRSSKRTQSANCGGCRAEGGGRRGRS